MKPVFFIIVFTAMLNLFYTSTGDTCWSHFWIFNIYTGGCVGRPCFMVLRIMMLIAGTFLLTYTTSPIPLTDGLESSAGSR